MVEGWLFFLGQIPSKKKGRLPRVEFSPVIFEAVKRRMRCNYLLLIIGRWTLHARCDIENTSLLELSVLLDGMWPYQNEH